MESASTVDDEAVLAQIKKLNKDLLAGTVKASGINIDREIESAKQRNRRFEQEVTLRFIVKGISDLKSVKTIEQELERMKSSFLEPKTQWHRLPCK